MREYRKEDIQKKKTFGIYCAQLEDYGYLTYDTQDEPPMSYMSMLIYLYYL